MIPWVQVYVQDISHPSISLLGTTLPTADQEGIQRIVEKVLSWC